MEIWMSVKYDWDGELAISGLSVAYPPSLKNKNISMRLLRTQWEMGGQNNVDSEMFGVSFVGFTMFQYCFDHSFLRGKHHCKAHNYTFIKAMRKFSYKVLWLYLHNMVSRISWQPIQNITNNRNSNVMRWKGKIKKSRNETHLWYHHPPKLCCCQWTP